MYGLETPAVGGDTIFANQHLAYEALSETMQTLLGQLRGVNTPVEEYAPNGPSAIARDSMSVQSVDATVPRAVHPLVRTHPETGRKALYVNETFTLGINNSPPGGDDFDPSNPRIHLDGNGNSSYDGPALDPLYTPGSNDPLLDANGNDSVVLFVLNDIPAGLTASIALTNNDTIATLTLTGNATDHEDLNDVLDLTFEFDDSAFTATLAASVQNATGPASSHG